MSHSKISASFASILAKEIRRKLLTTATQIHMHASHREKGKKENEKNILQSTSRLHKKEKRRENVFCCEIKTKNSSEMYAKYMPKIGIYLCKQCLVDTLEAVGYYSYQ